MISTRSRCRAALSALALLLCSCSKLVVDQATINRDAVSRCVQNIDAWNKDVAKLNMLQEKFDLISNQIRRDYSKADPAEKTKLRARLGDVVAQTELTAAESDALFHEIVRDLEYVSRDKHTRARIIAVTSPLRDAEGIRTPEVQYAMDAVSSQLQILLRVD
ncbi:MAG: hypothetical protein ABSD58_05325 [Verrucomicrobiia bacterium]|jgi:hypothetical protein